MRAVSEANIQDHFKLVYLVINRYFRTHIRVNPSEHDDLFQIGCIGLLEAIRRYDPDRAAFSTFAIKAICSSISKHVTRNKLIKTSRSMPVNAVITHSIDAKIPCCDKGMTFHSLMVDADDESRIYVSEFIERLKPLHQEIVRYRMAGLNQNTIASIVGLSQAYVSRILKQIGNDFIDYMHGVSA